MAITSRYPLTRPSTSVNLNRKKILISGAKFSRSSVGTYVDENGLIKNAEYNEPRFNYDSETGEFLGLLVEESRTNSTRNSTDLSSTSPYYIGTSGGTYTFSTNQTVAPDGTTTAGSILFTGGYCGFAINSTGVTDPTITVSLFAKYITGSANTHVRIQLSPFGGGDNYGLFNLTNGTSSASGSVSNVIITPFPNGWYRCSVTATHSTTWPQNSGDIRIWFHGETSTETSINNTDRTYVWGVQLEAGSYPTSYIPTSGSTVTREADTFELPIKTFKSGRIQYSSEIAGNSYYGNIALKDSINTPEYSLEIGSANSLPTISTKFSNVLQSTASLTKLPSTTTKAFSLSFNFDKDTGKIDFSTPVSDDADASVLELPSKSSRKLPSGYSIDTLQVLPGTNIKEVYLWNEELDVNKLSSLSEDFASINTQVVETEGYSANRSDYDDLPSLDLNFARNKSLDYNLSGDNLITFTRGSTATYVGADGLIKTAAIDTPRFDHDPDTLESLGLLVEESRTNLFTYSNFPQITPTSWASGWDGWNPAILLTSQTLSPNGVDYGVFHGSINSNGGGLRKDLTGLTAGGTYYVTFYVKGLTSTELTYFTNNNSIGTTTGTASGAQNVPWFAATQVKFSCGNLNGTGASGSNQITLTQDWQRFGETIVADSAGSARIIISNNVGDIGTGNEDGGGTWMIWGAQLEANASFATSYIPTTSSTVTRATDVASITGTNFSSWYNQSEGTVFAEYDGLKEYARVLDLRYGKPLITNRSRENQAYDGVTSTTSAIYPGLTLGDTRKSVTAYSGTTTTLTINGLVPNTGNSDFTSTTSDGVYLGGQGNNTNVLNGHISRLTYWPTRLPDTKLQEITSLTVDTFDLVFDSSLDTSGITSIITTGNCTYEVDWGDGSAVETIVASGTFSADHTYIFPSKYNAKINVISGVFRPYYNNSGKADQLVEIRQTPSGWTNTSTSGFGTNLQHAWRGANNLEFIDKGLNISGVNDLYNAWKDTRITSFPLLDTSSGTDFSNAWRGCSNLASFPLLNTSSGTIFVNAWRNCSSLTRFPKIDTSSANNVAYAWNDNANLVSFPQLDFSSVLNETGVYEGFSRSWWYCTNLENFPAGCFDNTAGTYFYQSFNFTKLNAESVSNILSSINNANTSDGVLGIFGNSASSPAGNYDWNSAGWDGFNGLISRNWTIDYVDNLFSSTNTPLDLQFAATKTLDSRITFTRGSTGTYVDSNGIIQTAAVDTPRFDHDPVTGESLGLLIEESRTNLLTYSSNHQKDITHNFLNGYTSTVHTKVTNIDPPVEGDEVWIIENQGSNDYAIKSDNSTQSGYVSYTIFLKRYDSDTVNIASHFGNVVGTFNLVNGTFTNGGYGVQMLPYSNGWYKIIWTRDYSSQSKQTGITISPNSSTGVYVSGIQIEVGSFPTSYIPTTGTIVTRATDVASITGTNFSSWYNTDESTVYFEGNVIAGASGQYALWGIQGGSSRINGIQMTRRSQQGSRFNHYDSGSAPDIDLNGPLWIDNSYRKLSAAIGQSSAGFADSGSLFGTDNSYQLPSASDGLDSLYLGSAYGGGLAAYNVHIKRLAYWPKRLPDGALKYITQ